jgi:hypothetical protein
MNASHFMHYNLLKTTNIFQFASVHHIYKNVGRYARMEASSIKEQLGAA